MRRRSPMSQAMLPDLAPGGLVRRSDAMPPYAVPPAAELVAEWLAALVRQNYSPKTIEGYKSRARAFLRAYPGVPLETITSEHIDRFIYAKPVSPRTKALNLEEIRAFFKWLVNVKLLLKENPCDRVPRPRWKYRYRPAPSLEDFKRVRASCQTFEETLLVEFLYFTGVRHEECRTLKWDMIELPQCRGRLVGKGGRERWFFFPAHVQALLEQAKAIAPNPGNWVFPCPAVGVGLGWPWSRKRIADMLRAVGKRAGLPYPLTAHILRHGWFRLMKTQEVPVEVAAKVGGNSIEVAAQIYGRMDTDDLYAIYNRRIGPVSQ